MKIMLIGFLSICYFGSFSQNNQMTNTWFLSQFRIDLKKHLHILELGHRRQEVFITDHRQSLIRYTGSYQTKSKKTGLGGGFACFIHEMKQDEEWELRPFLQLTHIFPLKNSSFQMRFRNEFRFFDGSMKDQDRIRLHLQFSHSLISEFDTKLVYFNEWFYIVGNIKPWEWRGGMSIMQPVSKNWKVGAGYIYQNNENSFIRNIHIVQISVFYEFLLN